MAKSNQVADAEIIACHVVADLLLMEMQDLAQRIQAGRVEKIEHPSESARHFAMIARAASDMVFAILYTAELQKRKDGVEELRRQAGLT